MFDVVTAYLAPVLLIVVLGFLYVRLGFASGKAPEGGGWFLAGGIILVLAFGWQIIEQLSGYPDWFKLSVYPVIDFFQFVVGAIGLALVVAGVSLYADFWHRRGRDLDDREARASLLYNLQMEARQPYQLLELLNIAVRDMLAANPGSVGSILLMNRSRRQFILTASAGLSKQETAYLEYYPLERNIVSQSLSLGDALVAGGFDFVQRDGSIVPSRFKSVLVLPLVSGTEKLGCVVLWSEEEKSFGKTEIGYLTPVVEWLAEKIRSARLTRELTLSKGEQEKLGSGAASFQSRLAAALVAAGEPDGPDAFCRSLVGTATATSVHLCTIRQGVFAVSGGSEPMAELSENYKTALIEAIDRQKPLIINHESIDSAGQTFVALSSLICPIRSGGRREALVLRREAASFDIDDGELRTLDLLAQLAGLVIRQSDSVKSSLSRRVGFEKVLHLLRFDVPVKSIDEDPTTVISLLADILPEGSVAITYAVDAGGVAVANGGHNIDAAAIKALRFSEDAGPRQAVALREPVTLFGKRQVSVELDSYPMHMRTYLQRALGGRIPQYVAYCPIFSADEMAGVVGVFILDMLEQERIEWERLLTLAFGLYSLRLTMHALAAGGATGERAISSGQAELLNSFNNHLSAVIGRAEMLAAGPGLSGLQKEQLKGIVAEAEAAVQAIKQNLPAVVEQPVSAASPENRANAVNRVVEDILLESHISGNLFLAAGKPREINERLQPHEEIVFAGEQIRGLFEAVLHRFASLATDDDVITVATYQRGECVYLDISRHRKNFPPVEPVVTFGQYQASGQAMQERPTDVFLAHLSGGESFYAVDKNSTVPAYLSFKFPLRKAVSGRAAGGSNSVRVLAIDDQPIILDLLQAMCQSLGYAVQVASSGEAGVRMLEASAFDIVLVDFAMPGMSGLEVARAAKRLQPQTPVVLVTGWEAKLDPAQYATSGVVEVLYKPFRIEQLTEIIQNAVRSRVR